MNYGVILALVKLNVNIIIYKFLCIRRRRFGIIARLVYAVDYDGADDGDEELAETAVACGADAEELEDPAAYSRTYDTKDEVKDAAIAAIALDTAGDVASDDTENDYINPVHIDKC